MAPENQPGLRVLWATDGSDESRSAIPLLRELVLPATQRLSVLSVAPQSFISGARPEAAFLTRITPAARRRAVLEAEDVARQAATDLNPAGLELEAVARWGNAIEEVLRFSRSSRADLVVMGAKGHSNLELILLGSVTQGVVQNSNRPVLIARPGAEAVSRVIIGFDGSTHARKAVQFLDRLSLPEDSELHLVYVVEPLRSANGSRRRRGAAEEAQRVEEEQHTDAERALRSLSTQLSASGKAVQTSVVHGPAGPSLDNAARDAEAQLIVVGSRKPSPESQYLLGTTAEKLVRHSRASVLVVR